MTSGRIRKKKPKKGKGAKNNSQNGRNLEKGWLGIEGSKEQGPG